MYGGALRPAIARLAQGEFNFNGPYIGNQKLMSTGAKASLTRHSIKFAAGNTLGSLGHETADPGEEWPNVDGSPWA